MFMPPWLGPGAPIVQVYHETSFILPDVSRVLACLYEKDVKFEICTASYKSLLRLQASSHAPVPFYDGPTFLEESREICRYLAEKYEHRGNPFLLGKDALQRASVEQWLHNEEHAFNPPSRALFCHLAFPQHYYDDDIRLHIRKLEEVLDVYEQRLGDSEYLAGNRFTLADLAHLPNCHHIAESGWLSYLLESRRNVRRWWNAISSRQSWQQVSGDVKMTEQRSRQLELMQLQAVQKKRRAAASRQVRKDPRKHIIAKPPPEVAKPPLPDDDDDGDSRPSDVRITPSGRLTAKLKTILVPLPPAPAQR